MRAPTSGVIHQLAAHTIGGVIRAGDTIMEVVPDSDDLQIEARLQPNDIDQVRKGQQAYVRFSAFNQRVTPQLIGEVSYVSPDTTRDTQTNMSYFTVRIMLPEDERRRLAGLQLSSGMPAGSVHADRQPDHAQLPVQAHYGSVPARALSSGNGARTGVPGSQPILPPQMVSLYQGFPPACFASEPRMTTTTAAESQPSRPRLPNF